MKIFALGVITLLSVSNFSIAEANLPPILTLKEKVESAKYIFIGVADKMKIFKVRPEDFFAQFRNSTQDSSPVPPCPYRSIEFDVHLTKVIKSGKWSLPKVIKLKLMRAFLDEVTMKREMPQIVANISGKERIYLVDRVDFFTIENVNLDSQIKTLVQSARTKANISSPRR